MNTERIISGEEILLIKKTNTVKPYDSEKEAYKGKTYRVYAFGDKGFVVHEDDMFHQAFDNGEIKTIQITVTDAGWSLANCVTWKQATGQKINQMRFDSITVDSFKRDFSNSVAEII